MERVVEEVIIGAPWDKYDTARNKNATSRHD